MGVGGGLDQTNPKPSRLAIFALETAVSLDEVGGNSRRSLRVAEQRWFPLFISRCSKAGEEQPLPAHREFVEPCGLFSRSMIAVGRADELKADKVWR